MGELAQALTGRRVIWVMIPAGQVVDVVINNIRNSINDIISLINDTINRIYDVINLIHDILS